MKPRPGLIASLALNLALAVVVVVAVRSRGARGESGSSTTLTPRVVRVRSVTNSPAPAVIEVAGAFHWSEVESQDYRVYLDNLRAIGCPEATIRDIIVADVDDLFAGRVRELVDSVSGRFWDLMVNPQTMEQLVETKRAELDAMKKERAGMLRALFGEKDPVAQAREEEEDADAAARMRQRLDFLSDEKRAAIKAVKDRVQTERDRITNANLTGLERREKFQALDDDEQRQILALLSPAEADEYRLRTQGANLSSTFDATPDELRALARANLGSNATDQVKELLGPERFAEYQRASDNAYQQTLRITDRFELAPETAAEIYRMQKEAEAERKKIRADKSRTPGERRAILRTMQAEAERSVAGALGPEAFEAYRKYSDGWLSRFADGVEE